MNRVTKSGANARAVRDFSLALRSGPFRVALVLSLIVHLVLLAVLGWGGLGRPGGSERRIPLMRVRLLAPEPPSNAAPAVPADRPPIRQPRREPSKRPAAAAAPPVQAPPPQSVEPAPSAALAPEPAPAAASVPGQAPEMNAFEATPAPDAPTAQSSPAPPGGAPGAGPAVSFTVPAKTGGESGGPANAGLKRGLPDEASAAVLSGDAGTAVATEAAAGPSPGDFASVRRRIDARKVYPQIAVRNGWEGRVLVEMRLEGDGRLAAVRLLEGSGYAVLDDETIAAVRRASPFPPVARVLTVPVEYRLVP